MLRYISVLIFLFLFGILAADAQTRVTWRLSLPASVSNTDTQAKAKLDAEIESGWHLYALEQPAGGPIATTIKISEDLAFTLRGPVVSPRPIEKPDPNFIIDGKPLVTKYFVENAAFEIPVLSSGASLQDLAVDVRFQLCSDTLCLPPKTQKVSLQGTEDVRRPSAAPPVSSPSTGVNQPSTVPSQPTDIWPFIWLAISLGALSLLTPCVFPMIPITVSYFTNHSRGSQARAVKLATIYSLGIVATFTILGMLLAIFVGAAGVNLFAANPWINLIIAGLFIFFAFNLFGAFEINIPTSVLTSLDKLTRSKEGDGSGVAGALLMGLTFTLTSFTCTSPFVGTILVSASQGNWKMPLIGMLAFSSIFALPFFVLALVPQLLAQLPRAGGWMNSVKVAMGFLEVAAAMKFISNVDLVWKWGVFTRDVVLSVWIAIGVILCVYLLGKFQLSHDSKPERLGALRMVAAVISLAVSFYLLTGLFGAKLGELESFLPPDLEVSQRNFGNKAEPQLKWLHNDYEGALAKARTENKLVFVDFTGYTCTNCRWMEANVFPKPEVEKEFSRFVLAKLFTDGEGEVYERQQQLEQDMLGTVALPYYAIVRPDGTVAASFPGLTRNTAEFVDFLRSGAQN